MESNGVSNASLSTLAQLQKLQKIKSRFFLFPQLQTVKCIYQYIDYCNDICAALSHLLMYNTPSLGDVLCHVAF